MCHPTRPSINRMLCCYRRSWTDHIWQALTVDCLLPAIIPYTAFNILIPNFISHCISPVNHFILLVPQHLVVFVGPQNGELYNTFHFYLQNFRCTTQTCIKKYEAVQYRAVIVLNLQCSVEFYKPTIDI